MSTRRSFGKLRKLPSGRWQASYVAPDGKRRTAPHTFKTKADADTWLSEQHTDISGGRWRAPKPKVKAITFAEYAQRWLDQRDDLAGSSRRDYRYKLNRHLLPTFGDRAMHEVTHDDVRQWYVAFDPKTPAARKNAYVLLHSIFEHAVDQDRLMDMNPVQIKRAGAYQPAHNVEPATVEELATLADAMPKQWRLMVLLAAWCALRFGEVAGLKRADVDLAAGTLKIRRSLGRGADGKLALGPTKTAASRRTVAIPPHLIPELRAHLKTYVNITGLLFTNRDGGFVSPTTFYGCEPYVDGKGNAHPGRGYKAARYAAGRTDLNFHALRHTGATMAAQNGATVKELMYRLGHTSERMALHYQHASAERDQTLAKRMSEQATGFGKSA